jgi:hypothetical protein
MTIVKLVSRLINRCDDLLDDKIGGRQFDPVTQTLFDAVSACQLVRCQHQLG